MVTTAPPIFPPSSLAQLVYPIAALSERGFDLLKREVASDFAFDPDKERCERLAPELDLTPETVALILRLLSLLDERRTQLPAGIAEASIRRFVDEDLQSTALDATAKSLLAR